VSIVDENDPEKGLAFDKRGEIAPHGPSIAKAYWNMPDATAAVFRHDGWFLTGDIWYFDDQGLLYITDRKKDMIILSVWKIYPTEVENVIVQHPAVADVTVFGVPDERKGEIPVAAVVLKEGISLTLSELESYCRVHLAGYKIRLTMKIVSSLPRGHG
jgi:long-chain acyl-CoA synthetase